MEFRIQTYLFMLVTVCCSFFGAGCGAYHVEEEAGGENAGGPYEMGVEVSNAHLFTSLYPLEMYLLDKQGKLAREEHISFPEEWPEVQQESGEYTLSLFSGLSAAYLPPMVLDAKQFFRFLQGNYADVPLLVGKNIVNLKSDMKVSVSMSYAVAAVYLSLGGIPEGAIAVEARISPVSSGISLEGNLSNDGQFATVECRNEKGVWKAGPVYVFPAESTRTHLSVNVTTVSGETTYGYFFNCPLEAGKPYRLVSTGDGNVSLGGHSQIEGWTPEVSVEFPFENMTQEEGWEDPKPEQPDKGETGGSGDTVTDEDTEVITATQLPESESIWGPFFVWKAEPLSGEAVVATLVSPRQWLVKKAEAASICTSYEEDGIRGWRTFTTEEAKEFREQYSSTIVSLSEMLRKNGLDAFNKYDCRYLCNDCKSTFCFYNNKILSSGATVEYALRLVKRVYVKKTK